VEYLDSDNEHPAIAGHPMPPEPPEPTPGKNGRGSRRSAARRRQKRAARQAAGQTGDKQVTKKRRLEALKNTIYVDYSLPSDAPATKPGWIGKRITGLPKRVFSVTELLGGYGMKQFPWDGLWVPLILPAPFHSRAP
jgi:hypothetical protein